MHKSRFFQYILSMNDELPDEFMEFLKRELTPEKLSQGFANVARPGEPEVLIELTPEQLAELADRVHKIIINPATSYGLGTGMIFEAASADDIRKLPGGDTMKIFPASSSWLQDEEDAAYIDLWNRDDVPSKPGMHRFRVFPK